MSNRINNLLVVVFLFAITFEYSKIYFPFFLLGKSIDGESLSYIDLARVIIMLMILSIFTQKISKKKLFFLLNSPLFKVLSLYTFYLFVSVFIVSNKVDATPLVGHIYYYLLFIILYFYIREESVELILKSFVYIGVVTGLLAIFQTFSGVLFWNFDLLNGDNNIFLRANVFFTDPNILSRYLVVWFVITYAFNKNNLAFKKTFLLVFILAIIIGQSRGAIVTLFLIMLIINFYKNIFNIKISKKYTFKTLKILLLIIFFISVFAIVGEYSDRFSLDKLSNLSLLGARLALIDTAFNMWIDSIFFGHGFGNFSSVAVERYSEYLPYQGNYVTHSHTYLMTVLAELGLIGAFFIFLIFKVILSKVQYFKKGNHLYVIPILIILICFINSQSISRFLDEYLVWLSMAIILVIQQKHKEGDFSTRARARLKP
jgi:O-antigen ligase